MTIEINGMAHVILTVSRFDVAREFYRKLLPAFGMTIVFDGDNDTKWRRAFGTLNIDPLLLSDAAGHA